MQDKSTNRALGVKGPGPGRVTMRSRDGGGPIESAAAPKPVKAEETAEAAPKPAAEQAKASTGGRP